MGLISVADGYAPPLCRYWPDCLPGYSAIQKGPQVALDPKNVLARIHGMILTALEDSSAKVIGWMPSHLTISDLCFQLARKSDGILVDERDLQGNRIADELAKQGGEACLESWLTLKRQQYKTTQENITQC